MGAERLLQPGHQRPARLQRTLRTDYEAFFLLQNLMLVGQGMGLGGWMHSSVFAPCILQRDPAKGCLGLGFRMHVPDKKWGRLAAATGDAAQPGRHRRRAGGTLSTVRVKSMDDAVDSVLDEKYGSQGTYGDKDLFAQSYRTGQNAEEFLRNASHYSKEAVQYTKEICNYLVDTYGRFPAHIDAFHTPGIWLQFSHLELDYYQKFYNPALFTRQARHDEVWGEH